MTDELVFYTNPMSRGRIVRWMLEEVGQPYRTELLDYAAMRAAEYRAINPMGKVPAIRHGDVVVTEAAAICAYLADAFPQAGLAPAPTDRLRGTYYRWLFFAAGPVEAAATNKSLGVEPPADRRASGRVRLARGRDGRARADREYIVGDRFSAADLYVGSHIGWGMQFGTLERRPAFERYTARIMARPAAVRAREIDDALLPKQPSTSA
jgi:glutathione S-transferase